MPDYRPNSHRFREDQKNLSEKKVEKVVSGKVKVRKKGELTKLRDIFISEDITNVKSYVFMDILVPTIKKAISDIVRDGVDMILYGEVSKNRSNKTNGSYVSYRDYSRSSSDRFARSETPRQGRYDLNDITLERRSEAEDVLQRMGELIDTYGVVSVADLFDLVGVTGEYTDNRYGWTSLRTADMVRTRDGYKLRLPKPTVID